MSRSTQRRLIALRASNNGEPHVWPWAAGQARQPVGPGNGMAGPMWVTVTERGFDHEGVAYGSLDQHRGDTSPARIGRGRASSASASSGRVGQRRP